MGLPVSAHGEVPEEIVRSVTLGYRTLEHNGFSELLHDDVLTLLAAAGTYWTPQYTQWIPVGSVLALKDPDGFARGLRLLGRDSPPLQELALPEPAGTLLGSWILTAGQLRRARDLGVRMLTGTDNYGGPGWVHVEFEAFQDAGFTPAEVLRMATLDAARAEGVEDHLGILETGKLADLRYYPTGVNPSEKKVEEYSAELRAQMDKKDIPYCEDMLEMAHHEGVRFLACKTSADPFDLEQKDFMEGVEIMLASDFMKQAAGSDLHLVF